MRWGKTMNVHATEPMKRAVRKLGRKVRGCRATESEEASFDRIDRALAYINTRRNRGHAPTRAWYELPLARHMWEADARDLRA